MKMDTEDYVDLLSARAADARAMMMFFAVFHTCLTFTHFCITNGLFTDNPIIHYLNSMHTIHTFDLPHLVSSLPSILL